MRNLWLAACGYAALGLTSGLVYRTLTHDGFTGKTQLSTTHTHFLALGMLVMLIMLALDAALGVSGSRSFKVFFVTYNAGLLVTVGTMIWHGLLQLDGKAGGPAIAGVAGLGHILITAGVVALLVSLRAPIAKHLAEKA
ncbi:Protein of uncharacterised function (DUF2871) [Actinomyces bovis]|uniref:Protein of uncharacterized function (DUF2871) n=1 Tax=Actinomyces bovis TaxID=1658 RepID=A0ABY1VPX9_9ACTO|nr:DUF2871 domain-containing protein [Actinomyces bovis]SPT54183.1 Protein of uncharacterised function (DUF2871) [Actinomyces bovis]VEG56590.1 Protein of uncharacterised function (DUF2871) [Actinomyces israelii]